MRRTILATALLLSIAVPAAAQDHGSSEVTTYDFMDDLVEGGRFAAEGERLLVRGGRDHHTLIRARAHWIPELTKSVEDL